MCLALAALNYGTAAPLSIERNISGAYRGSAVEWPRTWKEACQMDPLLTAAAEITAQQVHSCKKDK